MINYFILPSIKLGTLDILKRLLYVSDSFCVLCSLLVPDVFADFFAFVAHEELHQSKDQSYKTIHAHVLECEVD